MSNNVALIVAAGSGTRLGGELPKQYLPLAGRPVLRHVIERFSVHPAIAAVRVVINPDHRPLYDAAVEGLAILPPVAGGSTRQASVLNGLESLVEYKPDRVLIHDAARPFVDSGTIDRMLIALQDGPAALMAVPLADTLKRGVDGTVSATVDRTGLWRAQTPQGFRFAEILAAHKKAYGVELTDDAAVAEAAGLPVCLVTGTDDNFKITTTDDLRRAERFLAGRAEEYRTATGFDVHRFTPGSFVTICGVRIEHGQALEGHSDADVGLHALTDAVLGTIGAGDLGIHFPPNDPRWRGADSAQFLAHAAGLVAARRGRIAHVDVTLICERPKIGPHRAAMIQRIAGILGIGSARVSVKATTTEGLGFTGRSEGIAAQAAATAALPADRDD